MSKVTMDQHVEWVTLQVRRWFETEEPEFAPALIAYIRRSNKEDGNEPPPEGGEWDEDVEYLAEQAQEFATTRLIHGCGTALARELVRDALSEADWLELAGQWLEAERK
jgi:hypothetical protein